MRPITTGLATALQAPQGPNGLMMADLFTIALVNGSTYRWTSFDRTITYSYTGDVFQSQFAAAGSNVPAPLIQRTAVGVKNTVEVPELTIKLSALDTAFVGGVQVKEQLHNGYFDGAAVYLDRLFMPYKANPAAPIDTTLGVVGGGGDGTVNYPGGLFGGRMSETKITAYGATLSAKGANVLMNQYIPRNVYQYPCLHTFCDSGCTLSAATFTHSFTTGSGPAAAFLPWATAPANPLLYRFGVVTMTSGAANAQQRTVKFASAAGLYLYYPFYELPAAGDTFAALQGCDKEWASDGSGQTCQDYANQQHYRGFKFIPVAETAF